MLVESHPALLWVFAFQPTALCFPSFESDNMEDHLFEVEKGSCQHPPLFHCNPNVFMWTINTNNVRKASCVCFTILSGPVNATKLFK